MIRQLRERGLLRRLVLSSVGWSVIALVAFALPAFFISNQLIVARFQDEARSLANNAVGDVSERIGFASSAAATIAGLPDVGQLVQAKARPALFANYLLPVKSRLKLDVLNVSTPDGVVIGAAQDIPPGQKLPPELLKRAGIKAEEAWVVEDESRGLTVHAISVVRDPVGNSIAFVEAGVVLNAAVLSGIKQATDAELVLLLGPSVRAATLPSITSEGFPTTAEVSLMPSGQLTRDVVTGGQRYLGTFSVFTTHNVSDLMLAVLVPLAPLEYSQRLLGATFIGLLVLLMVARAAHRPGPRDGPDRPG